MRLGAREYFPPELGNEHAFRAAVERLILEHQPANAADVPKAPVIAVMGAKGGVGATFLSCQLAAALQRIGGRAAIVDLNLRVGDGALPDLHPRHTSRAWPRSPGSTPPRWRRSSSRTRAAFTFSPPPRGRRRRI
jgi:Flp pilus assembly CpaE family ATPase